MDDKITVKCTNPECGIKFRAPRTFVGKMVACKACGTRLKVDEYDEASQPPQKTKPATSSGGSSPPLSALRFDDEPEEDSFRGGGYGGEDQLDSRAPVLTGRTADGIIRDTERYPSLHKYLKLLKWVQKVLLIIGQVAAIMVAVIGLFVAFGDFVMRYRSPGFENNATNVFWLFVTWAMEIGFTALVAGLIWFVSYLSYLVTMAGIEIVYVLIDIEQHTRISRAHIEREASHSGV